MKTVRIVIEVDGKRYEVRGDLVPIAENLSQRATERDARKRVEKAAARNGEAKCPEHGKAMLGKYGLFCPVAVGEKPDGRTRYCNWRPSSSKEARAA